MTDLVHSLGEIDDGFAFSPVSAKNPFRRKRVASFLELAKPVIAAKGRCRVLDIGGTPEYWLLHQDLWAGLPIVFELLNTYRPEIESPRFPFVEGDARDLKGFADASIDLVHSNSVIEHVGPWADVKAMAREVRRVGRGYFVQTPYVGFPFEPHFRLPFFHWLPVPVQMSIVSLRKNGYQERAADVDQAMGQLEFARLLGARQMRYLFPDAEIVFERFLGLRKSLMAVKPWSPDASVAA